MELKRFVARAVQNAHSDRSRPYGECERRVLSREGFRKAHAEISSWPGYEKTPLVELTGLARQLGVGEIFYKDEGQRLGLKSFKAIGGAYAVLAILQEYLAAQGVIEHVTAADLIAGKRPSRDLDDTPHAPRGSAVPSAGKGRKRGEPDAGMEPQPQV